MSEQREKLAEESALIRETYAAMRARIPQRDLTSARDEFDAWLAQMIAEARAEGAELGRRATLDPGAFTKRGPDYEGNDYGERIDHWQQRAIRAALAAAEPDAGER